MIYLHIGLPKTATSYLQSRVFPLFSSSEVVFNPPEIIYPLLKVLPSTRSSATTKGDIDGSKHLIRNFISENNRKIFLSDEAMSTDGYCPYYSENLSFLRGLFDDVQIIISIRNQYDWWIAMYKQSVQQGNVQSAKMFFDYSQKIVATTRNCYNNVNGELPRLDVYAIDWPGMIRAYKRSFGPERVHILVYEKMIRDPELAKTKLSEILGAVNDKKNINTHYEGLDKLSDAEFYKKYGETREKLRVKRQNRSLSMFGIQCLRALYELTKMFGRPMPYKVDPAARLRANKLRNKFKVVNSWWFWREIWQRRVDKVLYLDWNPIPGTGWSTHTHEYFSEQNRDLATLLEPEKLTDHYYRLGKRRKIY